MEEASNSTDKAVSSPYLLFGPMRIYTYMSRALYTYIAYIMAAWGSYCGGWVLQELYESPLEYNQW
jgi:hypothetical protein